MDIAFEAVGSHGKYQRIIAFLVILVAPLTLIMSSSFPFMTKKPSFLCKEKESLQDFHTCPERDLCKNKYFDYKKNIEESLYNWSYEFDLYCSKSYIPPLIGTSFFSGGIVGSIILSPLPDQYGRKDIYNILLVVSFILHLNVFFTLNEWHLLITNILLGISSYSCSMSTLIITEYIDRTTSGIIMSINNAVFPFSGILIALFFIYVNDWRILFLISSLLSLLCLFISKKYVLESPRWLNSKNRFVETLTVMKEIAKINGNEETFMKFLSVNSSKKIYAK